MEREDRVRSNYVKHKIKEGTPSIGTWLASGSPLAAEVLAHQGFDWLTIDTEHNAISIESVQSIFQAIATTGVIPFARVPWNDPQAIKRVLDVGAYGVVVPTVESTEEAERAVGACRYPPQGYRGMGTIRGRLYGGPDYAERANEEICVVLMLETITAVERADEILSVPGIDAVFIGPNDLAASMGLPLGLDNQHPDHLAAVNRLREACESHGVPPGIHVGSAEAANRRKDEGFKWIAVSSDIGQMTAQSSSSLKTLNWSAQAAGDVIHEQLERGSGH